MKKITLILASLLVMSGAVTAQAAQYAVSPDEFNGFYVAAISAALDSAAIDTTVIELKNADWSTSATLDLTIGNSGTAAADSLNLGIDVSVAGKAWMQIYALGNDGAALNGLEAKEVSLTTRGRFIRIRRKNVCASAGGGNNATAAVLDVGWAKRQ